jgi:hypothetical protein
MKLHEILQKLADDEISMQGLNAAITGIKSTRNGNAVTFLTDGVSPGDLVRTDEMPVMICLFINREAWKRERATERGAP